ncbi:hypothetical protein [Pseudoduganella sp. R-43]|uniref:hypothetical protein n=1 Tax=unclassified Pseudoduganella TaxID=2637179 RepID=UPI003CFB136A
MTAQDMATLEKRKAGFNEFYGELMPVLVDFVGKLGIQPAHEVLNHAAQFAPYVEQALQDMLVADEGDRAWLLTRMGYWVGEYFVQEFGGCWFVNDIPGSRYFSRYVVGKFAKAKDQAMMIDPFEIAASYVDTPPPRRLTALLAAVAAELAV